MGGWWVAGLWLSTRQWATAPWYVVLPAVFVLCSCNCNCNYSHSSATTHHPTTSKTQKTKKADPKNPRRFVVRRAVPVPVPVPHILDSVGLHSSNSNPITCSGAPSARVLLVRAHLLVAYCN
jgi:hypothetical protein